MGYYTYHELEIVSEVGEEKIKEIEQYIVDNELNWELNKFNGEENLQFIVDEYGESSLAQEPSKWYESTLDMKKMTLAFPDILFKMHGEGEESGDLWDCYYLNGKYQYCPVMLSYEPFSEEKLKEINY